MSEILFKCPQCLKPFVIESAATGRFFACTDCAYLVEVPEAEVKYACAQCHAELQSPKEAVGAVFHCPNCQNEILVPPPKAPEIILPIAIRARDQEAFRRAANDANDGHASQKNACSLENNPENPEKHEILNKNRPSFFRRFFQQMAAFFRSSISNDGASQMGKINYSDPRYTWEIAKYTKNLNDLIYIYSMGRNDNVTWEAIINPLFPANLIIDIIKNRREVSLISRALRHPNCPPQVIGEVLEKNKDKDNAFTQSAILSIHCPTLVLSQYLERGIDNETTRMAAINQNVSRVVARQILEKGKDDAISWNLAKNAASPKDAVETWLVATGRKQKDIFLWGQARKQKKAEDAAELAKLFPHPTEEPPNENEYDEVMKQLDKMGGAQDPPATPK